MRPSLTGLSIKELGEKEYKRRYSAMKIPRTTKKRWWTGLSRKALGDAYWPAYDAKVRERNAA